MEEKFKISEAEWEVMKIIWEDEPITANKIIEKLEINTAWKPKTIKTLINRLLSKDALSFEKKGKEYLYFSKLTKEACIRFENEGFLKKVHDGALKNLLVSFLDEHKLSTEEITELKEILDEKSRRE